jgi:hypothetical protein
VALFGASLVYRKQISHQIMGTLPDTKTPKVVKNNFNDFNFYSKEKP